MLFLNYMLAVTIFSQILEIIIKREFFVAPKAIYNTKFDSLIKSKVSNQHRVNITH